MEQDTSDTFSSIVVIGYKIVVINYIKVKELSKFEWQQSITLFDIFSCEICLTIYLYVMRLALFIVVSLFQAQNPSYRIWTALFRVIGCISVGITLCSLLRAI